MTDSVRPCYGYMPNFWSYTEFRRLNHWASIGQMPSQPRAWGVTIKTHTQPLVVLGGATSTGEKGYSEPQEMFLVSFTNEVLEVRVVAQRAQCS
jgi:N-acetylneuraminic acid mutarotase